MKAILIIEVGNNVDFQKDFAKIRLFTSNGRGISYYDKVKLKRLPEYVKLDEREIFISNDWQKIGWNNCLRNIIGEE